MGRYESDVRNTVTHTDLKTKLSVDSSTDIEVHTILDNPLFPNNYFRFSLKPENVPLDES